jgi:hypothetical protein
MFAKTAKYQVVRARQAAPGPVAFAHANDNTIIARAAGRPRRTRRPNLVCRWRPMIGGGLQCHWDIESADGAATEGPDQRWMSGSAGVSLASSFNATRAGGTLALPGMGRGPAAGRLALLAAG